VGELKRMAQLKLGQVSASKIPDDVTLLNQLVDQGLLIGTPSKDYDDSYSIQYAKQHGGYIISNDMYRDHIDKVGGDDASAKAHRDVKQWVRAHVISYAFVGDEFVPNPDASFS
jgi:ribonuclease ZC3H12